MYLDTDILLALIKQEDWLKKYVVLSDLKNPKTSALNIIEARIVLNREYSREHAINVLSKVYKLKIKIIEIDEKIIKKSQELIERYANLNMFDAIHAATSIINNEVIIGTDNVFDKIIEVKKIDPRTFNR